jgi:hypothetical protein
VALADASGSFAPVSGPQELLDWAWPATQANSEQLPEAEPNKAPLERRPTIKVPLMFLSISNSFVFPNI